MQINIILAYIYATNFIFFDISEKTGLFFTLNKMKCYFEAI